MGHMAAVLHPLQSSILHLLDEAPGVGARFEDLVLPTPKDEGGLVDQRNLLRGDEAA